MTQQDNSIPSEPANLPVNNSTVSSDAKPPSRWKSAASTLGILIAAPVIALILTAFVFQSYEVDGPSMETTLQNQDRLIVWKAPHTFGQITGKTYIPERYDVIVFKKSGLSGPGNNEKQLIKRVIGLPGDRVVVNEGHITIYNAAHPDGYNPDSNQSFSANIATLTTGNIDITVPNGEVFVCGDNRTNSQDSRSFGTIRADDIVGKLTIRIFPVDKFKSFI